MREHLFLLKDVLGIEAYANLPGFADAPMDLVEQVLEEGAKFCQEVLAPLNKIGDEHGCTRSADGAVTTPPGFKDAYKQFVAAGWPALSSDPNYGGQGLPHVVALAWSEMCSSSSTSSSSSGGTTTSCTPGAGMPGDLCFGDGSCASCNCDTQSMTCY